MIADNYLDIARRMKLIHAPEFSLPDGMLILTSVTISEAVKYASWVFLLERDGLRLIKSRDRDAFDFIEHFCRYLPSALALSKAFIMLSPEDHRRLIGWLARA